MARTLITLVFLLIACKSDLAQQQSSSPELDANRIDSLRSYLAQHRQSPEEYVLSKFDKADVVILGEQHRARHDPLLVQQLIPLIYQKGVYFLGLEFARRIDQPLVDSLLSGAEYDQNLANEILLRQFVHWGYVEYADIYRAAWQLNHSLPPGSRPFRILALNNAPKWSEIKTREDSDNPDVRKRVWHGETEQDWARVILDEVIAKGDKALAFCGIYHGFTAHYRAIYRPGQPLRIDSTRFGNYLYQALGKRAITIYLHNYWEGTTGFDTRLGWVIKPADGYIDAAMSNVDSAHWRVGFDTHGTPFGDLPGASSSYAQGRDNFTLSMFCDGYIFQMPFDHYQPITCIPNYYTEANIAFARANAVNPFFRDKGIAEFEAGCSEEQTENLQRWEKLSGTDNTK